MVSFDGSARTKRKSESYSAIVWKLPWTIISAVSEYAVHLTVNAAKYWGMLLGLDLLDDQNRGRVIICGDSNLVIRQMRGEMNCKAPELKLLRHKAMQKLRSWPEHEFLHMKPEWNQSAGRLSSAALQHGKGAIVNSDQELQDLMSLNRLQELILPEKTDQVDGDHTIRAAKASTTRCFTRRSSAADADRTNKTSARGRELDRQPEGISCG